MGAKIHSLCSVQKCVKLTWGFGSLSWSNNPMGIFNCSDTSKTSNWTKLCIIFQHLCARCHLTAAEHKNGGSCIWWRRGWWGKKTAEKIKCKRCFSWIRSWTWGQTQEGWRTLRALLYFTSKGMILEEYRKYWGFIKAKMSSSILKYWFVKKTHLNPDVCTQWIQFWSISSRTFHMLDHRHLTGSGSVTVTERQNGRSRTRTRSEHICHVRK